ncbi:methionyl-tRNA formyltransferase [Candidatus Peribacteria bacterium]|nr:MAG: methionyl-tRNA formyltransferase [Candidatus Peribacteria bacterium]
MKTAIIAGNGDIAIRCTQILQQHAHILAVSPDPKDTGTATWQPSFAAYAESQNLPLHRTKLRESLDWLKNSKPDFLFSFQCAELLTKEVIESATYGVINLHFSPLPRYRGCFPGAWSLLNGETEMGVTLHYIDEGIDTGDIIAQKIFPIQPADTAKDVYLSCIEHGTQLFSEHCLPVLEQKNTRTPQKNEDYTYYGRNTIHFSEKTVQWNQPTERLYNWIRAFTFPPLQWPVCEFGSIVHAERRMLYPVQSPGTVISRSDNTLTVATLDGALYIHVEPEA